MQGGEEDDDDTGLILWPIDANESDLNQQVLYYEPPNI
jgi:hypothetical protein